MGREEWKVRQVTGLLEATVVFKGLDMSWPEPGPPEMGDLVEVQHGKMFESTDRTDVGILAGLEYVSDRLASDMAGPGVQSFYRIVLAQEGLSVVRIPRNQVSRLVVLSRAGLAPWDPDLGRSHAVPVPPPGGRPTSAPSGGGGCELAPDAGGKDNG